ncbi:MAG: MBL fold metallo-hydrolase [Clostridia bacterium]|nr:MBL fold metallo-hydrolase [Clostridia bacterium]
MLKFFSLYSGSTGNSLLLQSENCNLLIDSGVSAKKIVDGLEQVGSSVSNIDAILVTHEHSDHVQSLGTISKKYNIPVYANRKTWDAMKSQKDKIDDCNIKYFATNEDFEINDILIHSFSIPHDAADPCGFNFTAEKEKFSVATDIGHMTTNIIDCLENSKFLMLEANYEPEVLKCSRYPYLLKTRIAGPNGHLSNQLAGKTIARLMNSGLEEVMLGHLSKENNFPELAHKSVLEELHFAGFNDSDIKLKVASRNEPTFLEETEKFYAFH